MTGIFQPNKNKYSFFCWNMNNEFLRLDFIGHINVTDIHIQNTHIPRLHTLKSPFQYILTAKHYQKVYKYADGTLFKNPKMCKRRCPK